MVLVTPGMSVFMRRGMFTKVCGITSNHIRRRTPGRLFSSANASHLKVFNMDDRVEAMRKELKPPVGNKMLHNNDLQIMFVGGPNNREDFHLEHGQELFIQLEGDMDLKIIERNTPKTIRIKEGEIFLLPGGVPHSPQRYENTIGLVFERKRKPHEEDGLIWYHLSEEFKTRVPGRNVRDGPVVPPILIDSQAQCEYGPRALSEFRHSQRLFSYQSDFLVNLIVGSAQFRINAENFSESFMWYMYDSSKSEDFDMGERNATYRNEGDENVYSIEPNSVILMTKFDEPMVKDGTLSIPEGGKLLSVKFNRF